MNPVRNWLDHVDCVDNRLAMVQHQRWSHFRYLQFRFRRRCQRYRFRSCCDCRPAVCSAHRQPVVVLFVVATWQFAASTSICLTSWECYWCRDSYLLGSLVVAVGFVFFFFEFGWSWIKQSPDTISFQNETHNLVWNIHFNFKLVLCSHNLLHFYITLCLKLRLSM